MLKNISQLEHKIGERCFQFQCNQDSPLHEVKDALFQFMKYVGFIEDQVKAAQEKAALDQAAQEQVKEEPKPE